MLSWWCLCRVDFDLLVCRSVRAMDVVYTGNAYNMSDISKPSTGWDNLQSQEMNGFNEAFDEFLSWFDLNATTVESETAIEIKRNWERNAT